MKSWRIVCIAALLVIALAAPMVMADNDKADNSVVGMWHAVYRIGDANGPVFDESFQQFHSDGTEGMISTGSPPALGNVCSGVWKRVGSREYKLRHMAWNWSPTFNDSFGVPGTFAGRFEMIVRLRVDHHGKTFSGTWSAKNFDVSGNPIPAQDVAGVVHATRISVD